jgi:hypothetical protein
VGSKKIAEKGVIRDYRRLAHQRRKLTIFFRYFLLDLTITCVNPICPFLDLWQILTN